MAKEMLNAILGWGHFAVIQNTENTNEFKFKLFLSLIRACAFYTSMSVKSYRFPASVR